MKDRYISKREGKNNNIKDDILNKHNDHFIQMQRHKLKDYFQNMFSKIDPNIVLDKEQIDAIITDEDYEMIIAGAGSGKTTTMSAKVKYLIEILGIKPKDIIMISYTNEAVNELKTRINKHFNIPVEISTFHKFCLDIIGKQKLKIIESMDSIIELYFKEKRKLYHNYLKYHHLKYYFYYYFKNIFLVNDKKLFIDFLNRFQTNGFTNFNSFFNIKRKKYLSFIYLIQDIYNYYQNYLTNNHLIDFDGMINKCYEKLDNIKLTYKYLIIDEYQDISYIRFRLIQKIAALFYTRIIVVGDDFQSIYSFSGSNLSLFVDFERKMGYAKKLQITNTYRNSQELIDIIGKFVMKNQNQIKKELHSFKHLETPVILIEYQNDKIRKLEYCIQNIIDKYGTHKNILILGRYKHDINLIKNSTIFKVERECIIYLKYPNLFIRFLSVHASKGLGFDNVIIINNEDSLYGFPSKVKDHPYLEMLKSSNESYPYAEERRLFYVALTRTKNHVYLLYPKKNPSIFIKELKRILK